MSKGSAKQRTKSIFPISFAYHTIFGAVAVSRLNNDARLGSVDVPQLEGVAVSHERPNAGSTGGISAVHPDGGRPTMFGKPSEPGENSAGTPNGFFFETTCLSPDGPSASTAFTTIP